MNLRELMTLENVGWKVTVPKEEIINGIEAIFFDDISYDLYDWHTVKTFSKYFKVENIGGWRLPTIEELKYIFKNDIIKNNNAEINKRIGLYWFWCADEIGKNSKKAYIINSIMGTSEEENKNTIDSKVKFMFVK